MLLLKQNRDVYWNEGAYSTGVLIDKNKFKGGAYQRGGTVIGRKAANRIIMESSEKYNIRCKI